MKIDNKKFTTDPRRDVGKKGTYFINGMSVAVRVLDHKRVYGKDRWLITPLSGSGEVWTQTNPLT